MTNLELSLIISHTCDAMRIRCRSCFGDYCSLVFCLEYCCGGHSATKNPGGDGSSGAGDYGFDWRDYDGGEGGGGGD